MDAPAKGGVGSDSAHRDFLNRYYGISRHFYDLTRKYYLFGRDIEIRALCEENWESLVEVGPGTGRNLIGLHRRRRSARYGGIEASDAMLAHAQRRCPFARLVQGFAESADYGSVLNEPVDRILFSYCLSMVQDPDAAIQKALCGLAKGGQIVVVDFGDFAAIPGFLAEPLRKWLRTFHVEPIAPERLAAWGAEVTFGPGNYFFRARLHAR